MENNEIIENPFQINNSLETNITIPNTSFKKKYTSIEDLKKKINQDDTITEQTFQSDINENEIKKQKQRLTPILSLAQKKKEQNEIEEQNQNQIKEQNQNQIKEQNQNQIKEQNQNQIKEQNQNEIEEQNEIIFKNGNKIEINNNVEEHFKNYETYSNENFIEVNENHILLKIFPILFPPQNNFPIFSFWILILFLITFYGKQTIFRKIMIFILCIILYIILNYWNIYLALWNEGIYSDPWIDKFLDPIPSWLSTAQSPKEVKGILFLIYIIFILVLQIFLYFYQP